MKPLIVINIRDEFDPGEDVYIGRANPRYRLKRSRWANPFKMGKDGNREEIMAKYERYIREKLSGKNDDEWKRELLALQGKRLACWCKPELCHGDILVKLIQQSA